MDPEDVVHAPHHKRFKHQSYNQQLKDVHLPSAFTKLQHESEVADNDSHFHQALQHWRQFNLAPSFLWFANKADPLSGSMALLLHHWQDVVALWIEAMGTSDDEGLRALLDLLQKIAHDLRTTIAPMYNDILQRLLDLLAKSIAPDALETLLETFNYLFRYLLVPSIHLELLEQTWRSIKATLPKCLPEIQRAMAEVWGSVLRKLKSTARERAVKMLVAEADTADDASAWALIFACKSVSQTLHTATTSVFSPLLAYYLDTKDSEPAYNLLRRSLTALIHHVANAEQFSELGDLVIKQLTDSSSVHLQRALQVTTIICSVRQGSRLTEAQKMTLFAHLETLPIHSDYLPFYTCLFYATDMPQWIGPGLAFLQRSWDEDTTFAMKLYGSLAELGWAGWKSIALPLVLKATVRQSLLEKTPVKLFTFLASLARMKRLNASEVDLVWRTKIEKCALARLEELKRQSGLHVDSEINDILTLSSLFSEAAVSPCVDLIDANLRKSGADPARAWIIKAAIQSLSKRPTTEWVSRIPLQSWARHAIERWSWSHHVLGALVILSEAIGFNHEKLSFESAYPKLRTVLLSHSRPLRLNALRFLNSKLVTIPDGTEEVVKRCLQGEEATIDMQGVRERVLRIGRVGQVVGDMQGADVCARWLIAQLKVNLRPLWSPATAALGSLSQRFGEVIWELFFAELREATSPEQGPKPKGQGVTEPDQSSQELHDIVEEERSWRDPSSHKMRIITGRWNDENSGHQEYAKSHQELERFDRATYEFQLLSSLGDCSTLVEKHNRELIPYFLTLLAPSSVPTVNAPIRLSDIELSKHKLVSWFTLFSRFSNPKALYSAATLKTLYTLYLSHPYRPLQRISLSCLLSYKSPYLCAFEDKFCALLDDTRWRDELAILELGNLEAKEREEVVDVLTRILFGLMLEKKGHSRGADRRAAVLSALANCTNRELGLLVDLMLQPLGLDRDSHRGSDVSGFQLRQFTSGDGDAQMAGFLTLLGESMRLLGSRLVNYWPALIGVTIDLTSFAQGKIQDALLAAQQSGAEVPAIDNGDAEEGGGEDDDGDGSRPSSSLSLKALRSIRQLGLKRFADFFRVPISFSFEPYLPSAFSSFISPRLENLAQENTQSPSALLDLFQAWSRDATQIFFLVQYDQRPLPSLYDCLVATNVKPAVVDRVFDIVENILSHAKEDPAVTSKVLEPHVDLLLANLAKLVEYAKHSIPVKQSPTSSASSNVLSLSLTTPLGQRHLSILSLLAPYSKSPSQAVTLLNLLLPVFRKPNKQAPEKVKSNILVILRNMMHLVPDLRSLDTPLCRKVFDTLSHLLLTLRTRNGRTQLVEAFVQLGTLVAEDGESWLLSVAQQLASLNAYSVKRLDEADFDRRLEAYSKFNDESTFSSSLPPLAWIPLTQQSFFDIQDGEELAIRAAASGTLRRFVDLVTSDFKGPTQSMGSNSYTTIFLSNYISGLRALISTPLHFHNAALKSAFSVKADLLSVLAYTISHSPETISPLISALRPLLEGGDEEANFFNNVLHIQTHRRTRAIRRLGERCDKEGFQFAQGHERAIVRDWLLPIVSWFVGNGGGFSRTTAPAAAAKQDQQTHLTTNEAIQTIGKLSKLLPWSLYYSLLQRYLRLAKAKTDFEKVYVRTIVSILENFAFEITDGEDVVIKVEGPSNMVVDTHETPDDLVVEPDITEADEQVDSEDEGDSLPVPESKPQANAARRKPKILTSLKDHLLPALLSYLSPPAHRFEDDQNSLTTRLPIAISIARLTLYLPATSEQDIARKKTELRKLATELSHMMKSRSQDVRDSVRDVLGKIARLVSGAGEGKQLPKDSITGEDEDVSSDRAEYLKVMVEELATALTRGPQIHVLACTAQSILTKATTVFESSEKSGEAAEQPQPQPQDADAEDSSPTVVEPTRILIDSVIPLLSEVASAVLFGDVATTELLNTVSGQQVPVNHASAAFREPKKSVNASYALYALGAQFSSPSVLPTLLKDVRSVMKTTSSVKVLAVVDEVLRRVGAGLERNLGIEKRSSKSKEAQTDGDWLLNVIWGLVSGNVVFLKEKVQPLKNKNKKRKDGTGEEDHIVQTNRVVKQDIDHYAHNSFRFIVLGLDLLNTALRRGRFSASPAVAYRQLDSLLPVIGNTLYSTSTPVLLAALKSVSHLVTRFPDKLPGMRRALPVYVNQVINIIRTSGGGGGSMGGTDGDLLQTALRTLGIMIRDGPKTVTSDDGTVNFGVDIKEKDLTFLLDLVTPDLEDPEKQNVAFTFLRAIVSRRFITPEMYDIMEDRVAPLLVQSQSAVVREQARALLLQFMLDYPQGKGRLQKTLAFLLRNATSYVHESGRTSIFELLGAILNKFQIGLIKEYGEMLFVTLVMTVANDDSAKCKEAAAMLLATLYSRFDSEGRKTIVRSWLRKWVKAGVESSEGGKKKLAWVSLQVWGLVVDAAAKEQEDSIHDWCKDTIGDISFALEQSKIYLDSLNDVENDDGMDVDGPAEFDWQLPYYALTALGKVLRVAPSYTRCDENGKGTPSLIPWDSVSLHLLFPHAWVRTAACRTLGVLFNAHPSHTIEPNVSADHPFATGNLRETASKLCDQLKSDHLDSILGLQIVKNLVWIGRSWSVENREPSEAEAILETVGEDDDDDELVVEKTRSLTDLPWLFSKLSYQVRGALIRRRGRQGRNNPNWSQQPLAVIRWFAAMVTFLEPKGVERFLTHILSPLYRIIGEDTIRDDQFEELKATAIELRELVQQKVGGTTFSLAYNTIRQRVLDVQRDRKAKRVTLSTQHPERAARRKEKKLQLKKDSKKRKDHSFADARGGAKRRREKLGLEDEETLRGRVRFVKDGLEVLVAPTILLSSKIAVETSPPGTQTSIRAMIGIYNRQPRRQGTCSHQKTRCSPFYIDVIAGEKTRAQAQEPHPEGNANFTILLGYFKTTTAFAAAFLASCVGVVSTILMLAYEMHANIAASPSITSSYSLIPTTLLLDKLCRPGSSSSDDGHHETHRRSLNSNQPSSSSKQHLRDMESTSPDSPVSLKIPAPVHPNPTIRSQPLPVIDMSSGLPSRTSPSASSSRRASPTSLSFSDRYRSQHRSSLASNLFPADFVPTRQNDQLSDSTGVPKRTRPKGKLHLDKPKPGDATKAIDVDSGITLEARRPHEVHAANRMYFDRPSSS